MPAQNEIEDRPLTAWSVEVKTRSDSGRMIVVERSAIAAWFAAVEMIDKLGVAAEVGPAVPWRG